MLSSPVNQNTTISGVWLMRCWRSRHTLYILNHIEACAIATESSVVFSRSCQPNATHQVVSHMKGTCPLLRSVHDGLEPARIMPSWSPIGRCCLLLGTGTTPIAISLCHLSGWSGPGSYRAIILTVTRKLIFCVHYVGWTCLVHNASSWIHRCHPSLYYKLTA